MGRGKANRKYAYGKSGVKYDPLQEGVSESLGDFRRSLREGGIKATPEETRRLYEQRHQEEAGSKRGHLASGETLPCASQGDVFCRILNMRSTADTTTTTTPSDTDTEPPDAREAEAAESESLLPEPAPPVLHLEKVPARGKPHPVTWRLGSDAALVEEKGHSGALLLLPLQQQRGVDLNSVAGVYLRRGVGCGTQAGGEEEEARVGDALSVVHTDGAVRRVWLPQGGGGLGAEREREACCARMLHALVSHLVAPRLLCACGDGAGEGEGAGGGGVVPLLGDLPSWVALRAVHRITPTFAPRGSADASVESATLWRYTSPDAAVVAACLRPPFSGYPALHAAARCMSAGFSEPVQTLDTDGVNRVEVPALGSHFEGEGTAAAPSLLFVTARIAGSDAEHFVFLHPVGGVG